MVSKTSLNEAIRAFDWRAVGEGLAARRDLLGAVDEKGRNWLHHCAAARRLPGATPGTASAPRTC
jgi:hypothetical protein